MFSAGDADLPLADAPDEAAAVADPLLPVPFPFPNPMSMSAMLTPLKPSPADAAAVAAKAAGLRGLLERLLLGLKGARECAGEEEEETWEAERKTNS